MKTPIVTPSPAIPSERLLRSLSAAHTFGRLDNGLRALPDAGMTALRSSRAYAALNKAHALAQQAETMRKDALRDLATELTDSADGWTEAEVLHAMDNPLA